MSFSLQRHVLLVDDEPDFLALMAELFGQWSQGGWRVHCATNTAKALSILEEQSLDLVIVDWHMPVVDGSQFLALVDRKCPGLPKVILTGQGNESIRTTSLSLGADLFLEKPRSRDGLESVFAAVHELAQCHPQEGFRGMLRKVGLADVLQMECLARNSCVLEIFSHDTEGRITIQGGEIVHAETGEEHGEAAFQTLFSLRGGNFSLQPFQAPSERTIEGNWEMLVMEAARKRDEAMETSSVSAGAADRVFEDAGFGSDGQGGLPDFLRAVSLAQARNDEVDGEKEVVGGLRAVGEIIVGTELGDVLYAWPSGEWEGRLKLMAMLREKADQLARHWSLGPMDRLEADGPAGRVVVHMRENHQVWVQAHDVEDASGHGKEEQAA